MLVVKRVDGDSMVFHVVAKSVVLLCRIDDYVKLYYRNKLVLRLDEVGDSNTIKIHGKDVTVCFVKRCGYDVVSVGFEADRSVKIYRDDFQGAQL